MIIPAQKNRDYIFFGKVTHIIGNCTDFCTSIEKIVDKTFKICYHICVILYSIIKGVDEECTNL